MQDKLLGALKKYWGYDSFRPMQREVIETVSSGRDALALLPTGAGKSILYQLPAMTMEGLCIVITPLIALMKDQVDRLRKMHIPAVAIHSGLTMRQIDLALDNCTYGDIKFLYIAPERINSEEFRVRAARMRVCLIAVDEAHCISQWGYDFRPSYLRIAMLRRVQPDVPVLALTASATPKVEKDILEKLEMREAAVFRAGVRRDNLSFSVRLTEDKPGQLLRVVNNVPGCGIVYVRTRAGVMDVAKFLIDNGVDAESYHAGMPHVERAMKQEAWMKGQKRIMVSTNAFGMGIDRADVRTVVHYDMSGSLEEYYQEAGRAGRDGRRSFAVLLCAGQDEGLALTRFESEYPPLEKIRECYQALMDYLQVGIGDGKYASFDFNLNDFAAKSHMYTGTAMNCIKILQLNGYMHLSDETDHPARIMFTIGRDDLYKVRVERTDLDHFIRTLLRMYGGLFTDFTPVDEQSIASVSGYLPGRVKELFKALWQMRIIKYIPGSTTPLLFLGEARLPTRDVYIDPVTYQGRKQAAKDRIEAMVGYAGNMTECRSVVLQRYFGQDDLVECGICDICLEKKRSGENSGLEGRITALLQKGPLSPAQLAARFRRPQQEVADAIQELLERGDIVQENNKLRLK